MIFQAAAVVSLRSAPRRARTAFAAPVGESRSPGRRDVQVVHWQPGLRSAMHCGAPQLCLIQSLHLLIHRSVFVRESLVSSLALSSSCCSCCSSSSSSSSSSTTSCPLISLEGSEDSLGLPSWPPRPPPGCRRSTCSPSRRRPRRTPEVEPAAGRRRLRQQPRAITQSHTNNARDPRRDTCQGLNVRRVRGVLVR